MYLRTLGIVTFHGLLIGFPIAASAAHFLAPEEIDLRRVLPAPPSEDSLTTRAELDVIAQMERERTPAQIEMARNPPTTDVFVFASAVLGPWFNPQKLPRTAVFFGMIDEDGRAISAAAKAVYPERRRPFLVDARVMEPTSRPGGSTYPSGAGYNTAVWATLLESVFPQLRDPLQDRARTACWSRVVAGVHYPTDNTAGALLGRAVAEKLLQNPRVQEELAKIRIEMVDAATNQKP